MAKKYCQGRLGKRKCARCKESFVNTEKVLLLCEKCRTSCKRCGITFTDEEHERIYKQKNGKKPNASPKLVCLKCRSELARLSKVSNGDYKDKYKDYRLTKVYGITLNEYVKILDSQGGACWICKQPPKANKSLAVDHKHEKGEKKRDPREKRAKVRGLLCWKCNTSIAKFRDDPVLLRAAADYVERWPAQEILKGTE